MTHDRNAIAGPAPDLPLAGTAASRLWAWLAGVLIGLLVLVAGIGLATIHDLPEAGQRLRTVSITLAPATDPQRAAALSRAMLTLVRAQPGVAAAEPVTEHELGKLVEPWLGEGPGPPGQPVPRLIDVTSLPGGGTDAARLQRTVAGSVPGTRVDDVTPVTAGDPGRSRFPQRLAAAVGGLLLVALIGAVAMVVRKGLERHLGTVDLLRSMGAADGYVARQLGQHAMASGLRGGLIGFTVAMLSVLSYRAVLRAWPAGSDAGLVLRPVDWVLLAMVPVATSVVVTVVARLTAHRGLRRIR